MLTCGQSVYLICLHKHSHMKHTHLFMKNELNAWQRSAVYRIPIESKYNHRRLCMYVRLSFNHLRTPSSDGLHTWVYF